MADEHVDELYALTRDEFTPARDALASKLRAGGDRAQADEIKKLRKPTVAAWALNQVRRQQRETVDALLTAGERLRTAHEGLLAGGGREELAAAAADERALVEKIAQLAEKRLGASASAAVQTKLRATLHAVASSEEARAQLEAGRLTHDYEASDLGFGALAAGAPVAPRPTKAPTQKPKPHDARAKKLRERLEQAVAKHRELQHQADEAERTAAEAERAAAEARRAAERAAAAVQKLSEAADQRT